VAHARFLWADRHALPSRSRNPRQATFLGANAGRLLENRLATDPARQLIFQTGGSMDDREEPIRIPITDVFDLHTVQPREVAAVVKAYIEEANRLGLKSVRIIHGRGIGVQRQIVRAVLARTPFVISFSDAPPEAGGWGATLVRLR